MWDDEWPNWVDLDWEDDGCDTDFSWYMEYSHGCAGEVVIDIILEDLFNKYQIEEPSEEDCEKISDKIKEIFSILED
jgi:hypothetical protein